MRLLARFVLPFFLALLGSCAVADPVLSPAATPGPVSDTQQLPQLESAFWACDYLATTRGVLATPMAACQHATNELKRQKFGGSFGSLNRWWQENKVAEHARMEREAANVSK